jgi:hypothetical protein
MFDHRQFQRLGLNSLFSISRSQINGSCPTSTVSSFSCSALTRTCFDPMTEPLSLAPLSLLAKPPCVPYKSCIANPGLPARCVAASLSSSEFEPSPISPDLFKRALHLFFPEASASRPCCRTSPALASASPSCAALHSGLSFVSLPSAAVAFPCVTSCASCYRACVLPRAPERRLAPTYKNLSPYDIPFSLCPSPYVPVAQPPPLASLRSQQAVPLPHRISCSQRRHRVLLPLPLRALHCSPASRPCRTPPYALPCSRHRRSSSCALPPK